MMNETDEMRDARYALQELSLSDSAASANMMRYVAAYSLLVTGRRGRDRQGAEPQIGAGFVLTHGAQNLCAAAARQSGTDYLYIAFDVDDAAGPPIAAGVFSRIGDDMVAFGNCRLWSPTNDGRALLVPQGSDGYGGYLDFRSGRPFRHVRADLPGDFDAGARRAASRLRRLLTSDELRNVHHEGYKHVLQNEGERIFAHSSRLAA